MLAVIIQTKSFRPTDRPLRPRGGSRDSRDSAEEEQQRKAFHDRLEGRDDDEVRVDKSNIIMLGPTGCGKSQFED